MNRVRNVAPCPVIDPSERESGSIKFGEQKFLSGGGSHGLKGHTGSGKGFLDHVLKRC